MSLGVTKEEREEMEEREAQARALARSSARKRGGAEEAEEGWVAGQRVGTRERVVWGATGRTMEDALRLLKRAWGAPFVEQALEAGRVRFVLVVLRWRQAR